MVPQAPAIKVQQGVPAHEGQLDSEVKYSRMFQLSKVILMVK